MMDAQRCPAGQFGLTDDEQRALVIEVLRRPLAFDALGDGRPGLAIERLAHLAGIAPTRAREILDDLATDETVDLAVQGLALRIERRRDGATIAVRAER